MYLLRPTNHSQMIPSVLLKSENLRCLLSSHSWTICCHCPLLYGFRGLQAVRITLLSNAIWKKKWRSRQRSSPLMWQGRRTGTKVDVQEEEIHCLDVGTCSSLCNSHAVGVGGEEVRVKGAAGAQGCRRGWGRVWLCPGAGCWSFQPLDTQRISHSAGI